MDELPNKKQFQGNEGINIRDGSAHAWFPEI
jgi:hypothetical protein